jgi:hypothetical protein
MLFKIVPNAQVAEMYFLPQAVAAALWLMILHMLVMLAAVNVPQIRACSPHPREESAKHVHAAVASKTD